MNARVVAVLVAVACMLSGGCHMINGWMSRVQDWYAVKQLEWREARQQEFARLAALPPFECIAITMRPDCFNCAGALGDCAKKSCALFNEAQPKMKSYIDLVESSREYFGFVNDVQYYMEEEHLSERSACEKVIQIVQATDVDRAVEEKIWPRICRGAAAVCQVGTGEHGALIASLDGRVLDVQADLRRIRSALGKCQKNLRKAKKSRAISERAYETGMTEISHRYDECEKIDHQLALTAKCVSFMSEQYKRSRELDAM